MKITSILHLAAESATFPLGKVFVVFYIILGLMAGMAAVINVLNIW